MDGGAWWAAVYGVAQSRIRLKQLGSSSSVWSRLPFSSTGDLPNPGINSCLSCLLHWQAGSLPMHHLESLESPQIITVQKDYKYIIVIFFKYF